jgi:hypothetical protein
MYLLKHGGPPADGGHPGGWRTGGRADTPAGGGQGGAVLRMGVHAHAMGEGRMRREPQRGGREDASTPAAAVTWRLWLIMVKAEASTAHAHPIPYSSHTIGHHGKFLLTPAPVPVPRNSVIASAALCL